MLIRCTAAALLAASAMPAAAQDPGREPQSFEQRLVTIFKTGGRSEAIENRLNRVGTGLVLTHDQRAAIEGMQVLVRGKAKAKGLTLAEAESFAARHPASIASSILVAEAALAEDQPQRSADALIAAARAGGGLIDLISPAIVSGLADRLDELSDKPRMRDLARGLLASGWTRGSAALRSYLALEVIRDSVASARIDEARAALPAVASPASLQAILIDRRLAMLQPDVERLAGPRLQGAWRSYLTKARDDWLTKGDTSAASTYVGALAQANHHQTLVETFLPRFMRGYNCPSDTVARSIARDLAESLMILGRRSKADEVLARSGGISIATYAGLLLEQGEFGRAVAYFERSLKGAKPPKDKAEEKALAWLKAGRDCAVYRSRKGPVSRGYDDKLLELPARLRIALCLDRPGEARDQLIAALADESERAAALKWIQPAADPPSMSRFQGEMAAKARALRSGLAVVEAASRYGRILDWPLSASAPPESEMRAAAGAGQPWRCGEESSKAEALDQDAPQPPPPGIVVTK
jgi:hypothetical protein